LRVQTSTSADFMKLWRYASNEDEDENLSTEEDEASGTDFLQDRRMWAGRLNIGWQSLSRCVLKWYSIVHHQQPNEETEKLWKKDFGRKVVISVAKSVEKSRYLISKLMLLLYVQTIIFLICINKLQINTNSNNVNTDHINFNICNYHACI